MNICAIQEANSSLPNNGHNSSIALQYGDEEAIYENCDLYHKKDEGVNNGFKAYSPYKVYSAIPKRCSNLHNNSQMVGRNMDSQRMYGELTKEDDPPAFRYNVPAYF